MPLRQFLTGAEEGAGSPSVLHRSFEGYAMRCCEGSRCGGGRDRRSSAPRTLLNIQTPQRPKVRLLKSPQQHRRAEAFNGQPATSRATIVGVEPNVLI